MHKLDFSVSVTSLKSISLHPILQNMQGNPKQWLMLIVFQSVSQMVSDWCFSFQDQIQVVNPFLQLAIFHMLFNRCYAARSNEAIAIQLKRNDGLVGSPSFEGTRLADQSRRHPFAQLNLLSLSLYFNSLAAGL